MDQDDTHHRALTIKVGKGIVEWTRSLQQAERIHDDRAIALASAVVEALQSCSTHCRRGLLESVTNSKPTEPPARPRPTVTVADHED